ncbi:MAG: CRISPR system precrRNA processing endoribonuclease RAMP protein Cas6 [Candidatus Lokiarchaeota archaeon]|nr:CRISPR system precrRNA processing endoribonuclease RAMP protein Cas6 [Candidatus Lokiarchaeota archaeon]
MYVFTFYLLPNGSTNDRKRIKSHIFRGVFMAYLKEHDPVLIEKLHASNEIRSYAISYKRNKELREMIEFRIVSLLDEVSQALLQSLLKTSSQTLNIQGDPYNLVKIGFEKIDYKNLVMNGRKVQKFNIRYLSPAFFTQKGKKFDLKVPLPEQLIGNLGSIWNTHVFQAEKIPIDDLIQYVKQSVWMSSYQLETRFADIGKSAPKSGCVGWVNYLVEDASNSLNPWLDILLKFGEYSNVGGNRTAGLGVIKYNPIEYI